MIQKRSYKVRPFSGSAQTGLQDVFWVYLSPASLYYCGLKSGDSCSFETSQGVACSAIVKENARIQDTVVQTSKTFQDLYCIKLGDMISMRQVPTPIAAPQHIVLHEIPRVEDLNFIAEHKRHYWAWLAEYTLRRAVHLCPGMPFDLCPLTPLDDTDAKKHTRSFQIFQINGSSEAVLYRFEPEVDPEIRIEAGDSVHDASSTVANQGLLRVSSDDIAGLDSQLDRINYKVARCDSMQRTIRFPPGYPKKGSGIIIHGPSGTGKTLILNKIAALNWKKVFHLKDIGSGMCSLSHRNDEVRKIFAEARQHTPSLVLIPRLDAVAGKARQEYQVSLVNVLAMELDALNNDTKVLVVAETIDIESVEYDLLKSGRLDLEVETTVPDLRSRKEILRLLSGLPKDAPSTTLDNIGNRTHGYVGNDLLKLFSAAMDIAGLRMPSCRTDHPGLGSEEAEFAPSVEVTVTEEDLSLAMSAVRPSAMRGLTLEAPNVRWGDVAGQHHVKKELRQAIEWPIKYPERMERYGLKPKKGLLLYGPPGCSKTLIAKAIATESDQNFIAVKGAELLNMYVGESERAIRELFRKARSASPSIIFFDEIDCLGASRDHGHGGLNVLTTLLNELDGIEELRGVFVLAATNNPEVLDPALIRPGRLTTLLYVGLPDLEARKEILQLQLRPQDTECSLTERGMDITELAVLMDGYSGAEIVDICHNAEYMEAEAKEQSEQEQRISGQMIREAIAHTPKGITPEQLQRYEDWRMHRRRPIKLI